MIKLKELLSEAKRPPTRKDMAEWINAFNNARFVNVKGGRMLFVASNFALKGMNRELKGTGINIIDTGKTDKEGLPLYAFDLKDKNKFQWNESINEREYSQTYFDTFTGAAEEAARIAELEGYQIDEDDWFRQVGTGGRYTRSRPSVGDTHRFSIDLLKRGKPSKKALHFQVYNMGNKYELNAYVN